MAWDDPPTQEMCEAWEGFLKARLRSMRAMRREGRTSTYIANAHSMDKTQVESIFHGTDLLDPEPPETSK